MLKKTHSYACKKIDQHKGKTWKVDQPKWFIITDIRPLSENCNTHINKPYTTII